MKDTILTWHIKEKRQPKPKAFFCGKICFLIDNATYSSAADLAVMFRDYECGKMIGSETGGLPTSFGDVFGVTLKNSGIKFGVSYKQFYGPHPRPGDDEHGVLPDIPVTEEILTKYKTSDRVLAFATDYIMRDKSGRR